MVRVIILNVLFAAIALGQSAPPAPAQSGARNLRIEKDPAVEPERLHEPSSTVSIPRSYAVVIGISRYPGLKPEQQLHFADQDAELIYSTLISPEGGNFRAENVHVLTGRDATLKRIRVELEEWLPSVAKKDDRVLVYFAGHGFVWKGAAYFLPSDIDPANIESTGYPMAKFGSVMANLDAKYKILLADACHSGAIAPDADAQNINSTLADLGKSLFSLTASRDRERSFESEDFGGGHGIFTYFVVKGLEGEADESGDGIVTADELAEYVRRNVREMSKLQQNPTSDRGSFDSNMLLSYVPSRARPGQAPAPKFGTLKFESNMNDVEVFVDGKSAGMASVRSPLSLPGLLPGVHTIKAVHLGYEPDGPREETVYPGQEKTVTLKILVQRHRSKAAMQHFDNGVALYLKGSERNYRAAAAELQEAVSADPTFCKAFVYLARTSNALFLQEEAQKYFRKAIEADPEDLEAKSSYAGMLLDVGNLDEAVRQLTVVTRRDPMNSMGWYLLSQALCRKEDYANAIAGGTKAVSLNPKNAEAHFWLAEAFRLGGKYDLGARSYTEYLSLSNFDSKLGGQLNYYVLGYLVGLGKRKKAAEHDIWSEMRGLGYFGRCDCERKLALFDQAIADCQASLTYEPKDPLTHYVLGLNYMHQAKENNDIPKAAAARVHFASMLAIDSQIDEAANAKKMIASIDAALARPAK